MAAALFWFLLSSGGVVILLLCGAVWLWVRPASGGARRLILLLAVTYTLASLYPVPSTVGAFLGSGFQPLGRDDVPSGRTVVVLLGSGSYTRRNWSGADLSSLDTIGVERTLEAWRVFQLLQPEWLISSGGLPDDEDLPSARTMRDVLIQLGVPPDRILIEQKSRNTRDEAVFVAGMLPPLHVDHLVLVTSAAHMRRSLGVFRSVGLNPIPAISRDWSSPDWSLRVLPTEKGLRESSQVAHELVGLAYYWLRGWYK